MVKWDSYIPGLDSHGKMGETCSRNGCPAWLDVSLFRYIPQKYILYIYISRSQTKLSTTRAQCCRFVSQNTNLNNFVFSPQVSRLDEFCPGDWGERLTCSPSLNVLCPGAIRLRLDLLISECRNRSRNQEFHEKNGKTSILLFQQCIKYMIFACT